MAGLNIPRMEESPAGNLGQLWTRYLQYCNTLVDWYKQQTTTKKVLIAILAIVGVAGVVLLALFHVYIIKFLIWLSDKWEGLAFGQLLLFTLVFFVGFPPLLGFSSLSILSGMVYGLLSGWILLAVASISGSFCSFLVFRYLLRALAEGLLKSNEKFRAFAEILKEDQSLLLLILIRLCPLPYSLSNGALASIPELAPTTYLMASVITCPKLFIHVFIGRQLKDIGDETNTTARRVFDGISLLITALASAATTYIIYLKMQQRLEKYHQANPSYSEADNYNEMIFGNFDDDESGNNLELDSAEFDADNFIIDDEDPPNPPSKSPESSDSQQEPSTTPYRDY